MKIKAALLVTTALLMPIPAAADPVSAFFAGVSTFVTTGAITGAGITGAFALGTKFAAFFSTTLGSIALNVATSLLFAPKSPTPSVDQARVNVMLEDAPRWQLGGNVPAGGSAGCFAEYDEDGNLWYIVAHGDAEITNEPQYFLDDIPVTLSDGTDGFEVGDVITDEFCWTSRYNQYEGSGEHNAAFRLYTVTPDKDNVYGALPTDFKDAFVNLPTDFFLAGVCYTIVRCISVPLHHYSKIYKWRGRLALGEPAVVCYANYNRMYDPRKGSHDIDDTTTWTASDGNPAIVWAWFRTNPFGRNRPMSEVSWDDVAAQADICDIQKVDRAGNLVPNYRCGIAVPDNKPRHEAEREILQSADAFVAYDDAGRAYPVVGHYETPSLRFTAERDIFSAKTQIIDDAETPVDGVIVKYLSPDHNYALQPCSPWKNPNYYDGTSEPSYHTVEIPTCQNHNQAVRLAKAIGLRLAATHKAALATSIKGILARNVRTIDLAYDAQFTGDFEIASSVETDATGASCSFAVVPMQVDRYDLNEGEEGEPPQVTPALDIANGLGNAENVLVIAEPVGTSNGDAVRIKATFDAPTRSDRSFRFRHVLGGVEEIMATDMDELHSFSAILNDGQTYRVSWETVTASGRSSGWSDERDVPEFVDVVATANVTPPVPLLAFSAADGTGEATISLTTNNDPNQSYVEIYRNTVDTFGTATLITTIFVGPNTPMSIVDTGLAVDTYYYWAIPYNGSGVAGTTSGSDSAVVT